jgi:hypothetical protein
MNAIPGETPHRRQQVAHPIIVPDFRMLARTDRPPAQPCLHDVQSSTRRPGTFSKSLPLRVNNVKPCVSAMQAIRKSIVPIRTRWARISSNNPAASRSKGEPATRRNRQGSVENADRHVQRMQHLSRGPSTRSSLEPVRESSQSIRKSLYRNMPACVPLAVYTLARYDVAECPNGQYP